jgi:hypothetical protein
MYQHLPVQDPPKFTLIGIFGLKIYHLATLQTSAFNDDHLRIVTFTAIKKN